MIQRYEKHRNKIPEIKSGNKKMWQNAKKKHGKDDNEKTNQGNINLLSKIELFKRAKFRK